MTRSNSPYALRLGRKNNDPEQRWWTEFFTEKPEDQRFFISLDKKIRDFFRDLNLGITNLKAIYSKNSAQISFKITDISLLLGADDTIEKIEEQLKKKINEPKIAFKITVYEEKRPYSNPRAIIDIIAAELSKRTPTRLIMRNIRNKIEREQDVKGAKIFFNGLLDGSDMATAKKFSWGKLGLSTFDNKVVSAHNKVVTRRGVVGVTVYLSLYPPSKRSNFSRNQFTSRYPRRPFDQDRNNRGS